MADGFEREHGLDAVGGGEDRQGLAEAPGIAEQMAKARRGVGKRRLVGPFAIELCAEDAGDYGIEIGD
jgi:hypothetical protein